MQALQTLGGPLPVLSGKEFQTGQSQTGKQSLLLRGSSVTGRGYGVRGVRSLPSSSKFSNCRAISKSDPAGSPRAGSAKRSSQNQVVPQQQSFNPLPLPPKSLFPLPLQFLWFKDAAQTQNVNSVQTAAAAAVAETVTAEQSQEEALLKPGTPGVSRSKSGEAEEWEEADDKYDAYGEGDVVALPGLAYGEIEGFEPYDWSRDGDEDESMALSSQVLPGIEADGQVAEDKSENRGILESLGWRPHMLGFHSLWRGFRAHLRAAAPVKDEKEVPRKLPEETIRKLAQEVKDKKPAKASLWAMSALLDWRAEANQLATAKSSPGKNLACCSECEDCTVQETVNDSAHKEAPRLRIEHTAETMRGFLQDVKHTDLQKLAIMSVLCDMAYTIPQIVPADMYRRYRLRYVTSSLELKARKAAKLKEEVERAEKEKAAKEEGGKGTNEGGVKGEIKDGKIQPANGVVLSTAAAYALAAAAASYLQSQSMSLLPKGGEKKGDRKDEKGEGKEACGERLFDGASAAVSEGTTGSLDRSDLVDSKSIGGEEQKVGEGGEWRCKGDGQKAGSDPEWVTSSHVVDSIELTEGAEREAEELLRLRQEKERESSKGKEEQLALVAKAAVKVAGSSKGGKVVADTVCPCEWFVSDDPLTNTRYFVIQGSDSLASWHTNVSFDPVPFEDPKFGVMVHRGIYDAAKALYASLSPLVNSFLNENEGKLTARIQFTGHSLGGSLATVLNLMFNLRGAAPKSSLLPVYTFGSPSIMCGGDNLLDRMELSKAHVVNVMMHRDLVPRAFACDYPDHVAEVLRRMSTSFRDHPCLLHQRLMYAPMGTMVVLQPDEKQAPRHPLLPAGSGLYQLRHPDQNNADLAHRRDRCHAEVRAAQRAILNNPHPLEILADPGAYGTEGSISRDHDPRNYTLAINGIIRSESRKMRRVQRQQRRRLWWPLVGAELAAPDIFTRTRDLHATSAKVTSGAMKLDDGGSGQVSPAGTRLGGKSRRMRRVGGQVAAGGGTASPLVPAGNSGFSSKTLHGEDNWSLKCRNLIASQHVNLGLLAILVSPLVSGRFYA